MIQGKTILILGGGIGGVVAASQSCGLAVAASLPMR